MRACRASCARGHEFRDERTIGAAEHGRSGQPHGGSRGSVRPQVAYWPGIPDYANDFEKVVVPVGLADPTLGYSSATFDAHGVQLSQALTDGITDVLAGRRPLGDFDQIVKDWQNNGGNQMRTELQQAIAASA